MRIPLIVPPYEHTFTSTRRRTLRFFTQRIVPPNHQDKWTHKNKWSTSPLLQVHCHMKVCSMARRRHLCGQQKGRWRLMEGPHWTWRIQIPSESYKRKARGMSNKIWANNDRSFTLEHIFLMNAVLMNAVYRRIRICMNLLCNQPS